MRPSRALCADLLSFAPTHPAPDRAIRESSPCQGMSFRIALPYVLLVCLAAPLKSAGKMPRHRPLQPTYDTSTRAIVRLPSPRLAPRRPPPLCAQGLKSPSAIRRAVSDHLSVIRPRVEKHLTMPLKLRFGSLTLPLRYEEETSAAPIWRRYPAAALSAAPRAGDPTSDALCRTSLQPMTGARKAPGSLQPPPRQRERLSRPRAPSINKCPLSCCNRREPATFLTALPP